MVQTCAARPRGNYAQERVSLPGGIVELTGLHGGSQGLQGIGDRSGLGCHLF